jgi:hypothetical protein
MLAAALVLVGLAGTLLPALPGVPFVLIGLGVAAWIGDFQQVGWAVLAGLAVLTLVASGVDVLGTLLGAKRVGASPLALAGAAVGTVAGLFAGLIGVLVGPFLGAVAGELIARRRLDQAAKVGLGTWLGLLVATVAKLGIAFTMVGIFVVAYLI